MNIRKKLYILLGVLICTLILLGSYSIKYLLFTSEKNTEINNKIFIQNQLKHIQYRLAGISNDERAFLIKGDYQFPNEMDSKLKDIQDSIATLKGIIKNQNEKDKVLQMEKAIQDYWSVSQQVINQYAVSKDQALSLHFGKERDIRKNILEPDVNNYVDSLSKKISKEKNLIQIDMRNFIVRILAITVAISILGALFGVIIIQSIIKPLNLINKQMKEIASGDGDMTKKISVKNKDELGQLSRSFNDFVETIRGIIINIIASSERVAASSEEFSASAEQAKIASEHVTNSMQVIAAHTQRENSMTNEATISLRESVQGLANITSYSANVAQKTTGVKEQAEIGADSVTKIVGQMESIHESVENTATGIKTLSQSASQISNITELISSIASQTNLLALNAAIEAARAGEHGKGFAVVAEEVRKLAEQSNQSINQINDIVTSIQMETTAAVDSIQEVKENVSYGMDITKETSLKFNEILNEIEIVASNIQEIAATSEQLNTSFELVVNSVEEISILSKETSSNTEMIAASTEEQMASSEGILIAANSLTSLAEELREMIKRFKV
ncbi:methyl-accepting chemotaxis protein [Bacillus xiapuensis]|uniref:Methyl-accepting chemotaxis protein n=1 Tax=Bacillus xiapuensis TaxID=2014075 RepID=A0ABU6NB92_9BACI|nr:methyl-accepting chemotaxis protein [Bacillus xiapuensis]